MADKKKKNWIILGSIVFIVYIFAASTPIGSETVLRPLWLEHPDESSEADKTASVPFHTRGQFGYVDKDGKFGLVRQRGERNSLSSEFWSDYGRTNDSTDIFSRDGTRLFAASVRGYPFFSDGRIFMVGPEQNYVVELDRAGNEKWRRDFPSVVTCADAAAGLAVFGMLDGSFELVDERGTRVFGFEPGGSRLAVIASARLSPDGKRIAVVSGIDPQRFVLFERSGSAYKVAHHEYIDRGFRRPVQAAFAGGGRYVVFEREAGLAIHEISARRTTTIQVGGIIAAYEDEAADGRFFLISDLGEHRELVGIKLPAEVFMRAPFSSAENFIARRGARLYVAGAVSVAALEIKTK